MKVVGVLVCYYPGYKTNAVRTFKRLLSLVSSNSEIYIVNNNLDVKAVHCDDVQCEIDGSNTGWEFSAWDEALEHIERNDKTSNKESIVIFANDTFCHNRPFTYLNLLAFSFAIKSIEKNRDNLVGELCKIGTSYHVGGFSASGWISSYLFACAKEHVHKLQPLDKAHKYYLDDFNDAIDSESKMVVLPESDDCLNKHLSRWFYPKKDEHGWYKTRGNENGRINETLLRNKVMAVFNEKLLSAVAENNGLKLKSVYENKFLRKINYWQGKLIK